MELLRFLLARLRRAPYFGPLYAANQQRKARLHVMDKLIRSELAHAEPGAGFRVLEIGSWAGQSAVVWARACKDRGFGTVFCVDPWKVYGSAPGEMQDALRRSQVEGLFAYNIRACGVDDCVVPIKASSDIMAGILKPGSFDVVYIDGDHGYTQFRRDLLAGMNLAKTGGILCGDDLELMWHDVEEQSAKAHRERNTIRDPRLGRTYHPGITLAVHELLGDVSMAHGFWAVRREDAAWKPVTL